MQVKTSLQPVLRAPVQRCKLLITAEQRVLHSERHAWSMKTNFPILLWLCHPGDYKLIKSYQITWDDNQPSDLSN